MKSTILFRTVITVAVCSVLIFSSCKKDSSNPSSQSVSEEEAAQAITQSVTPESGGMVSQSSEASAIATIYTIHPCGISHDSSIALASLPGAAFTYAINLNWGWSITCASPVEFQSYFKGHTTYSGTLMSSNDSSQATMNLTGLGTSATAYTGNLNYVRNGSQQSKIGRKSSFTSLITITSTNITVDKTTNIIASGTAPVTISGASTGGLAFSYNGTLTFHGNKAATLAMSSGNSYEISWQ